MIKIGKGRWFDEKNNCIDCYYNNDVRRLFLFFLKKGFLSSKTSYY